MWQDQNQNPGTTAEGFMYLTRLIDILRAEVTALDKIVKTGNGERPLTVRVATIEDSIESTKKDLEEIEDSITLLATKTDLETFKTEVLKLLNGLTKNTAEHDEKLKKWRTCIIAAGCLVLGVLLGSGTIEISTIIDIFK